MLLLACQVLAGLCLANVLAGAALLRALAGTEWAEAVTIGEPRRRWRSSWAAMACSPATTQYSGPQGTPTTRGVRGSPP
jgi:hypothetical protein